MKKCTKCGEEKPIGEFNNWKLGKDGKFYQCKQCCKESNKVWRDKNKEWAKNYNKEYQVRYYKKNKKRIGRDHKKDYEQNKEKWKGTRKKYYEENKERLLLLQKERLKNPEVRKHRNKISSIRERKLLKADPNYKLKKYLRTRVWGALKENVKSNRTIALLGAGIDTVKSHLQSKFTDGMTWENYGEWHVDHVVPCDSFDLSVKENQRKCFHYTNLQPLWAIDNLKKSNKIIQSTG